MPEAIQALAAMGADDDEIGVLTLHELGDLVRRHAQPELDTHRRRWALADPPPACRQISAEDVRRVVVVAKLLRHLRVDGAARRRGKNRCDR
jgi:hypothetical protein